MHADVHIGIQRVQAIACGQQLRSADILRAVEDLPLQVARIDRVEVHQPERADAGRCKVERGGRAQPSRANAEHARGLQPPLPVDADLGHDQVTAVALHLIVGQLRQGLLRDGHGRAAGHGRHDADHIAGAELGSLAIAIADVVVVHVDVHEATKLSVVGIQMAAQIAVARCEGRQDVADGASVGFDDVLLAGVRAQRRGNQDSVRHVLRSPWSNAERSSRSRQQVTSRGVPLATDTITYTKFGHAFSRSVCDGRAG